jgi:hypothetical protein
MSLHNGSIFLKVTAIAFLVIIITFRQADCQRNILDSAFTFRAGTVKTGNALEMISKSTGYNFTYDSRLIDPDRKTGLNFRDTKLRMILNKILLNDSLLFSVIDKYIIISLPERIPVSAPDSLKSPETKYITGRIIDDETLEPLPFATIGLKNKGRGTVSNNNGEFGLTITPELINDTLSVSYLGYFGREIAVDLTPGNNFTIRMTKEFISIPEIIIKNQVPQQIVSKARSSISKNYGNTPATLTGFYREGIFRKSVLQTYSEAVLEIYKSAYSGSLLGDQIKIVKSRKIENRARSDTLALRLKGGLGNCLELDGARNTFDFLGSETMGEYSYRMTDIVTYDNESAFAIEFEQREGIDLPLYKGIVYINTADFGILNAEFEINQSLIHKLKDSFISNPSRGFITWPISAKYSVSYRKVNGRYFLSHVRGDLLFTSKQKKKLFNTQFRVFFELAVTETNLENVARFEREEIAPVHSIFSKTITNYDPSFWENQDFLRPEDDLLQALKNMKVRLQEFSK